MHKRVRKNTIILTDFGNNYENIYILVSAGIIEDMLTSKPKNLSSDLVSLEIHLGWILIGKVSHEKCLEENFATRVLSEFVKKIK